MQSASCQAGSSLVPLTAGSWGHVVWSCDAMAEQKKKGGRKKKADVIDVGDKPAGETSEDEAEEEEEKDEPEEGLDADLAAAATIDVGEEPEDLEVPEPKTS